MSYYENYKEILDEIQKISSSSDIISVSKKHDFSVVEEAYLSGIRDFGENSIQEGLDKIIRWKEKFSDFVGTEKEARIHHIGPLQKGTLRKLFGNYHSTHGVGSESSLKELFKRSQKEDSTLRYFLQLNLTREESKHGFTKEEWIHLLPRLPEYQSETLVWDGLMTMGPSDGDPGETRKVFRELRGLRDEYAPGKKLSMGMSGDYRIAVEEGSDLVRIGTAIFGKRNYE